MHAVYVPDSEVHGANMDPDWPNVGPMNLAIRGIIENWQNQGDQETVFPNVISRIYW